MGRNVCILLPRVGVYPELGAMMAEAFAGLGWQATVHHRAQRDMLGADLLLLAGLCRYIEALPEVLSRRGGPRRPMTVLWQLEPLPPVQLSDAGEASGFRVAACDWGRLPRRPRQALSYLVPFRTRLLRLARRWLARPYSGQVLREPDQQGWKVFDVENFFNASADWRWIKSAHGRGWLDFCFASGQPRVQFLRSRGIRADLLPFGYHPRWGRDLQRPRDVDVLFLGQKDGGPRGLALGRLREELGRRGCPLTLVRRAHGTAREQLLSRARITVNLLRAPHDLAGLRVLLGLACGTLVVSEHCDGTGAFQPGKHFVMVPATQMADTIEYYLAHEAERRQIADEGHRFVTRELTLANVLTKLLQQLTNRPAT